VRPSIASHVLAAGLLMVGVVIGWHWATHRDRYTPLGNVFIPAGSASMILVAFDALQRTYVISRNAARVRLLGIWKSYDLSGVTKVRLGTNGRLELVDPGQAQPAFMLPRPFVDAVTVEKVQKIWGTV